MKTNTIDVVNELLFESETSQIDLMACIGNQWKDIKIVDVIGITEEKGTIYGYIEVEYNQYCYLVNFQLANKWAYVYKDEYIEIMDELGQILGRSIYNEMQKGNTILDDVKEWTSEQLESYNNEIEPLNELVTYGCESGNVSFLIYNDDIQEYYNKHYEEINNIIKDVVGVTIKSAINNINDFDIAINNIGGLDCEMSFGDSHELEKSELAYLVWLAFEHVAHEYLEHLESK